MTSPLRRLGLPRAAARADLAILERDPVRHLLTQLGSAFLGFLAPAATLAALSVMGADIGGAVPLWLCLILAAAGFLMPDLSIHEEAEQRRLLMRHTLAALLDIIPPSLAAGAGIERASVDTAKGPLGERGRRWGRHIRRVAAPTFAGPPAIRGGCVRRSGCPGRRVAG